MPGVYAITGAKGTGKTTLFRQIESKLLQTSPETRFRFVPSPGGRAKELGLPLGEAGSDTTHIFLATLHLQVFSTLVPNETVFLDRCFIDHLAYVRLLSKDTALIALMNEVMCLLAKRYSAVFIAPLHQSLPNKSFPTESQAFREAVENELTEITKSFQINAIRLPTTTPEAVDRIAQAIAQ